MPAIAYRSAGLAYAISTFFFKKLFYDPILKAMIAYYRYPASPFKRFLGWRQNLPQAV